MSLDEELELLKKEIGEPPKAADTTALTGLTHQTVYNGAIPGVYSGELSVAAGKSYAAQVTLEANTKSVSWSFKEAKKGDISFGYNVTMADAEATLMAEAQSEGTMSQEPAAVQGGEASGKLDIPDYWQGGTLHLNFDNQASKWYKKTVICDVTVTT